MNLLVRKHGTLDLIMIRRYISKFVIAVISICLLVPLVLTYEPSEAQSGPCSQHPDNLIQNGSMLSDSGHSTPYGDVADGWEPFVLNGSPRFSLQTNENANGDIRSAAQHITSDQHPFDAGIYQVVSNVQPGVYYRAKVGQALAAVDYGGGINTRNGDIGRRVGIDPTGGTDPNASSVVWGNEFHDLNPALNIPDLSILVAARSTRMTVFARSIDHNSSGVSKIWFDVICLKPDFTQPTATPAAPTATAVPPTATVRPSATRAPATRIAAVPTNTPTPQVIIRAPDTPTPTAETSIGAAPATAEPRYARPEPTPAPSLPFDAGQGALGGLGVIMTVGGLIFFGIGILLWRRID